MIDKPRLSFWQIWNMSFGFLGIQFGWGLQMANMSAIYEYLGARPDEIPMLWLAAPLTGLLVQPVIGTMSDRTWGRLGRRRPYFLTNAFGVAGEAGAGGHAIPLTVKLSFYAGSAAFIGAVLWTIVTTKEYPPEDMAAFRAMKEQGVGGAGTMREILDAIRQMPRAM